MLIFDIRERYDTLSSSSQDSFFTLCETEQTGHAGTKESGRSPE